MSTKNAAAANCGFVLHLFVLILGGLYVCWIGNAFACIDCDEYYFIFDQVTFHQQGIRFLVIAFFTTILVYFVLNCLSVPSICSRDTIWDDYSQSCPPGLFSYVVVMCCSESRMARRSVSLILLSSHFVKRRQQQSKSLPSICDIDVAIINDMVWSARK